MTFLKNARNKRKRKMSGFSMPIYDFGHKKDGVRQDKSP